MNIAITTSTRVNAPFAFESNVAQRARIRNICSHKKIKSCLSAKNQIAAAVPAGNRFVPRFIVFAREKSRLTPLTKNFKNFPPGRKLKSAGQGSVFWGWGVEKSEIISGASGKMDTVSAEIRTEVRWSNNDIVILRYFNEDRFRFPGSQIRWRSNASKLVAVMPVKRRRPALDHLFGHGRLPEPTRRHRHAPDCASPQFSKCRCPRADHPVAESSLHNGHTGR